MLPVREGSFLVRTSFERDKTFTCSPTLFNRRRGSKYQIFESRTTNFTCSSRKFLSKGDIPIHLPYETVSRAQTTCFNFQPLWWGGPFFDFLERIRPKNKLGEFQFWGRDLLQKRKKKKNKKQQILSFRSSKKRKKKIRIFFRKGITKKTKNNKS